MRRNALTVGLALMLCAGLIGCSRPGAGMASAPGDPAVAKVDGQPVLKSDVAREAVAQGLIGDGEPLEVSSDLFQRVLDEVIDQKLLAAEAVRRGIDSQPGAQRRLAAARERILGDMVVEGAVDSAVNENAIRALYQEQLKLKRQGEEFHARQIVVAGQPEADSIKKQISSGASFEGLAANRSIDAETRSSGGDLGYFTADVMPAAYGAILKGARPGQIVGPFKSDSGWVVLKVEDRRQQAPPTLDASRAQIVRFLTYAQVGDLLKTLRAKERVELLTPTSPPGAAANAKGQP
ncbi:MAG: peptidylprolyl isomerase [Caulobacteraceae bacterium]|nr:peptidylprolyl isomerase [Caulobacteraceae bacterium]